LAWRKFTTVRNLAIFGIAILACLLAPSAVRNFVSAGFEEFRAPIDAIPSQISDLQKYWSLRSVSKSDLIEAGRDLARLNANYTLKVIENEALKEKVARLEKILNIPSDVKFKNEIARVARRDINAWWQYITIRKGRAHGIREGYGVIYSGGVVGVVSRAGAYTSDVKLVSSKKFRMATHFEGDDRPIIFQGDGAANIYGARGEITDVPEDFSASSANPLRLVTSSLAGTFPDGIPVGTVKLLRPEADGIFKSGYVELGSGLTSLREVTVLIPVSEMGN